MNKLTDHPPQTLFLVGDIFDLWVGEFNYFKGEYKDLITAFRGLAQKNVRMVYFQGNHDLYLEKFWGGELGFEIHREPQAFELMGEKFFVEHGDLMNPKDKGYLLLRKVLNNPLIEAGIKKLPGRAVQAIGERASRASRTANPHIPTNDEPIRQMIRDNALRRHREEGSKYVITGHVHVEDEWWSEDRSLCSVNLGSWHTTRKIWSWSLSSGGSFQELQSASQ